tara:strand:+ start:48 stop:776 length:729 start_codon:yes stop_codon:yes gene_type:complete
MNLGEKLNKKNFRHENKYFINFFDYSILKSRLEFLMKKDSYSDQNGNYNIRSLYFDDIRNSSLFEKQSGILVRKKYRIRIYNLNDDIIKLEKKSRIGHFINKETVRISKEQYYKIISKNYDFLIDSKKSLLREFYLDLKINMYKPEVIVDFVREAFTYNINNIRITFDKKLESGLKSVDLFNKKLVKTTAIDEPKMILEVKYDSFLPDFIKNALQISASQRYAISKYVICRKYIKTNKWEDN